MSEAKNNSGSVFIRCLLLFLGFLLMAGAGAYGWWLIKNKPIAKRRKPPSLTPMVNVVNLKSQDVQVNVSAMGVVIPSKEATLRARVSGEVHKLHKELEPGGIVKKDEEIIWIDDADYRLHLEMKKTALEKVKSTLQLELAQQRIAENQYKRYSTGNKSVKADMDLVLRKPQERSSRAAVLAAETDIKRCELDLSRTTIKAPFNAVVLERAVDIGEQADLSRFLVTLVGIDTFWVQASVPINTLKWIVFPSKDKPGSQVDVICRRGIREGRVLRLMSDLDSKGRMARILIEVKNPLDLKSDDKPRTPLLLGEYVRLTIKGETLKDLVEVPRKAYHDNSHIWLLTPENKLQIIDLTPVWDVRDAIYFNHKDIPKGKLILSNLGFPVAGMELTSDEAPTKPKATSTKKSEIQ